MQQLSDKIAFSINEVTQITPFSRVTLYRLMKSGKLGFTQIGRRRVITRQALIDLIEGHEAEA